MLQHRCLHDVPKPAPTFSISCLTCNEAFDTVHALQTHREASNLLPSTSREQKRSAPGAGTGPSPKRCNNQPAPGEFPYLEDPVSDDLLSQDGDAATKLLYKQKWSSIRIQFRRGHIIQDTYSFRLGSEDTNDLADNVWAIFRNQQTVFKITGFSWVTEKRGRCGTFIRRTTIVSWKNPSW
ncbi:hypothetical protein Bbelb_018840 [Branchiostoma belcheri]|nr:hypothetical protein Bbelb_018840 [Branchiostoma belcheri]